MLAAVELREGHVPAALRRTREADEHIRIHDQNWTQCLPWAAEIELWAGRASDTCPRLADVLARDLAGEQAAAAAPLLVALARAHAEVMDETAASSSLRRSTSSSLRAQVAGASTDPFGPGVPDVATTANALLWEAELCRLEDRATVDIWARAASQWDLLGRPHQSGYCRWRGAQVALHDGRGSRGDPVGRPGPRRRPAARAPRRCRGRHARPRRDHLTGSGQPPTAGRS